MELRNRNDFLYMEESSASESTERRPSPGKVTLTSKLAARSGAGSVNANTSLAGAKPGTDAAPGMEGAEAGGGPDHATDQDAGAHDPALHAFHDGRPLDPMIAHRVGEIYGESFSHVRVHTNPLAARLAEKHGSIAFTVGSDIAFAEGKYRPNTPEGDALLAHELAHVVQQRGASDRDRDRRKALAAPAANSMALEADADTAAESVVRRLYGGLINGVSAAVNRVRPSLGTNRVTLQRCPGAQTPPAQTPSTQPPGAQPPTPQTPAAPPPAVTVSSVSFGGSADRLAPTHAADVAVTIANLPSGDQIDLDVENAGGAHGDASITAGASLNASGNATVTAGSGQTAPAQRGTLFVRARHKGTEVGKSAGFTIACHPKNTTIALVGDVNTASQVGFKVSFT